MCQALREIREEAVEIGREEGRQEGRQEGMWEMIARLALLGKLNSREVMEECQHLGCREEDLKAVIERLKRG